MTGELSSGASFRLDTEGLTPSEGLSTLRELFDSKVQLKLETGSDRPVDARMTVHGLPGLRRARMTSNIDAALTRTSTMLSDGEDDVCLIVPVDGHISIDQRGRRTVAETGDGVLLVYREPAELRFAHMDYEAIRVPSSALAPLTRDIEAAAACCVRRDTQALHLLRSYLASLPARLAEPNLRALITTHVYDLMALAIGATRDARDLATLRGLRAARLEAIKVQVMNDREIRLEEIARRQAISPRYVQMLFEEEGTTFSEFVLGVRLEAAHAMLLSPRYSHWSIAAISLEAGFGDLSYFNRRFKARFSGTPSGLRARKGLIC